MTYIPHGTDPGEIGEGANIDVSVISGTTTGKFIGFGEDGTSAIANRAHYALSANIDHVYQEVHRDIAVNKRYDRTAGAAETSYQFPDTEEIWTGDSTYPGSAGTSDAEGMQMLFNIVDANYNELTDGEDNEVRVKLVRESTGVTDIYQGEFQSEPIIYFQTVNPSTGAVVNASYTIPNGTAYKILCGIKTTVAEMPADALIRFKVQASSEAEAGMFLQDGSRPMTGTLDLDDQGMTDENLTGALPLSEPGQAALYQPVDSSIHPSLVGAVNTNAEAQEMISGNRCMDRTGSISTGGTANLDVTYPALKVMLQGQVVDIAGDTITATDATDTYYLYVKPDGTVALDSDAAWNDTTPLAGSVLIWRGEYDAGTDSWSNYYDLRWPSVRKGNHVAIYVGTGVGADFTYLTQAAEYARWIYTGAAKQNITYEIVVVGTAEVQASVVLPDGWTLRGLSKQGHNDYTASVITTDLSSFPTSSTVIITGDNCVVEDLIIKWGRDTDQSTAAYGLRIGAHCLVEGVKFTQDSVQDKRFGGNIDVAATSTDMAGPVIRDCYFDKFAGRGVCADDQGRVRIENCTFVADGTIAYHLDLSPGGATGDDRGPGHVVMGCYFKGRGSSANILVGGPNVLIDSCQADLTGSATKPFIEIDDSKSQVSAGVTVRNCLLESGYQFVSCAINDSAIKLSVVIESCTIVGFANNVFDFYCTSIHESSNIVIRDCNIHGQTAGYIARFNNAKSVGFCNSKFSGVSTGILISGDTSALIDSNTLVGDDSTTEHAITVRAAGTRIANNVFEDWIEYFVYINPTAANIDDIQIANNLFKNGCNKEITAGSVDDVAASAIYIAGAFAANNVHISGNQFSGQDGSALRVADAATVDDLMINDNVFYQVGGRYLIDNSGPECDHYAVIYLGSGPCTISGNRFTECGHAYTTHTEVLIRSIIELATSAPVIVSNNVFKDSKAGATSSVLEALIELNIVGGDVICSNNSFYKDMAAAQSMPYQGYSQVYASNAVNVVITGCTFQIVGAAGTTGSSYKAVYLDGCTIHASNCLTIGTWTQSSSSPKLWDVNCTGGCVAGCVFNGDIDTAIDITGGTVSGCSFVGDCDDTIALESGAAIGCVFNGTGTKDLSGTEGNVIGCLTRGGGSMTVTKTNGFVIGNMVRGAGAITSTGTHPTATQYSSIGGSSPMLVFNEKIA